MERPTQLLTFALANKRCALHLSAVDRVVRMVDITTLPKAPEIVLGIINIKGRVIAVVDIRKRFCLPHHPIVLTDHLVITQTTHRPVAFIADAVTGVLEYSASSFIKAQSVLSGIEHVDGVVKLDDGLILIHSMERFLLLNEELALDRAISAVSDR